jgi:hypothetical protein
MHKSLLILIGVSMLTLLAACATAPVQEMSDARQAVSVAERAQPDSPEAIAARKELAAAEQALRGRQFRKARQYALEARELALKVQAGTAP